jgi:hypothetical protein
MGVTRAEAATVASAWPDPTGAPFVVVVVNDALNILLGYTRKRCPELSNEIGTDSRPVVTALAAWRGKT